MCHRGVTGVTQPGADRDRCLHYLVKFKGWPDSDNEWLPAEHLANAPDVMQDFHLHYLLRPVPPEMERPLGAGRLGLSHWAGPSVTGSAGWSQSWYAGIIVDLLPKESKFP